METSFEALYDARRNAIPSWQGYHYQGMVALLRFLEEMNNKCKIDKTCIMAEKLKLKIEWLEDFILFDNNEAKEIYQIKKTLTKENRQEVLNNFILQFKILSRNDTKWILGYDTTELTKLSLTKSEFEQFYTDYIENEWMKQIKFLESNYKDNDYWQENLNLTNSTSSCKTIRSYLRKLLRTEKKVYTEIKDREEICANYLEPLKKKLARKANDFKAFQKCMKFQQISIIGIDKKCLKLINTLFTYIKTRNELLTEQDILDKLYTDLYRKMMRMERKEEMDDFKYELEDIKKVFLDEDNSISCWEAMLYREKEKLLEELEKDSCSSCPDKGKMCSDCVLHTIKQWDMKKIIDNINLEYAPFSSEKVEESVKNKISDIKHDMLVDIMDKFKMQMKLKNNEILQMNHQYVLSAIQGGGKKHNETNLTGILNNYWKHSDIYRDYKCVLTQNYDYTLAEHDLSILKTVKNDKELDTPLFNEIRNTEFIDYRRSGL